MSWLSSLLLAVLISVGGTLLGGLVAIGAANWLAVSQREGYSGYWIVFWALVAGAYSFASALVVLRIVRSEGALLPILYALAAAYGVIAAVGLVAWLSDARTGPRAVGKGAYEIEVRLPADFPTERDSARFHGYLSAKGAGDEPIAFDYGRLRRSGDSSVLPGRVRMPVRGRHAYVVLGGTYLNQAKIYYFISPEIAAPGAASPDWSRWLSGSPSGDLGPTSPVMPDLRLRPLPPSEDKK